MKYKLTAVILGMLASSTLCSPISNSEIVSAKTATDMSSREVEALLGKHMREAPLIETRLLAHHILKLCKEQSFSASYVLSIIAAESGFHPDAVSDAGAMGLMQLQPETAEFIAKKAGLRTYRKPSDLFNPMINITIGVHYLDYLRERFGDSHEYLAAYNLGPTKYQRLVERKLVRPGAVHQYVEGVHRGVGRIQREGRRLVALVVDRARSSQE